MPPIALPLTVLVCPSHGRLDGRCSLRVSDEELFVRAVLNSVHLNAAVTWKHGV